MTNSPQRSANHPLAEASPGLDCLVESLRGSVQDFVARSLCVLTVELSRHPGQSIGVQAQGEDGRAVLVTLIAGHRDTAAQAGDALGFASQRSQTGRVAKGSQTGRGGQHSIQLTRHVEGDPAPLPAQPLNDLRLPELLKLAEAPLMGKELERTVRHFNNVGREAQLGQEIYAQLLKAIQRAKTTFNYDDEIRAVESVDRDARVRGELLGRHITQSVADGQSYYIVTETRGSQVRLQHLPVIDGYRVVAWGSQAWVEREYVEDQLKWRDNMERNSRRGPMR